MVEKFARSWALVKASAQVLRSDRELLLFPVISGLLTLLVMATFLVPVLALRVFDGGFGIGGAVIGFLFYFCQYSVIVFCNCALVGAAMIRLEGGDPSLRDGFDAAIARLPAILGYAAIAATVGVLLQALKGRRNNILVRLLGSGLGVAWTLAAFLVVPVLVSRRIGPIDALRESATLLRQTWGENIIGNVGIGAAFGLLTFATAALGVVLALAALQVSVALAVLVALTFGVLFLLLGIYQAALSGIYSAVLYRHATAHQTPAAFPAGLIEHAFQDKR